MSLLDKASLIVTPNAYKESKLYSVVPNTTLGDMDVVRATTATRVNSAGLIEVVPRNLLTYSNTFTDASWLKGNGNGGTLPVVTNNYGSNPFGVSNASRIQLARTSTSGSFSQVYKEVNLQNATQNTWSVWLKSLSGTPTITIAYNGAAYSKITLTTEWVRYELPLTTNGSYFEANFGTYQGEALTSLSADFLAYGFQVEQGSTATEYFPTTTRLNIPRIDYTNGSCPSLLVEPQRTNLLTYSNDFTNTIWTKDNVSLTSGITSPSGLNNAFKLIESAIMGIHSVYQTFITLPLNIYSTSIYVKKAERFKVAVADRNTGIYVAFNLNTGTIIASNSLIGKIELLNNDWYRLTVTTSSTINVYVPQFFILDDSYTTGFPILQPYTGNGTSGVLISFSQLEVGAYATSYIPTVASTVTRNADVISKTGISSLIGQTEGTVFSDIDYDANIGGTKIITGLASSGSSFIYSFISGTTLVLSVYNSGTLQCYLTYALPSSGKYKIAIGYKLNDFIIYVNGTNVASQTSGTVPTCSIIYVGNDFLTVLNKLNYNSVQLYKTRLTNSELQSLTTL